MVIVGYFQDLCSFAVADQPADMAVEGRNQVVTLGRSAGRGMRGGEE